MRVVGGDLRRRALNAPRTAAIRPTSDRAREALFNVLRHGHDLPRNDTRVLDVFAGTGALGIEALSRGAAAALFVDISREAAALVRRNLDTLELRALGEIRTLDATRLGRCAVEPFDLVFLDPPYRQGLGERALASLRDGGWLTPGALCVWEEAAGVDVSAPEGFDVLDERRVGEACLRLLTAN